MGLLFEIIFISVCLVILAIPSVLTYLLYSYLKKAGRTQGIMGLALFISTTVLVVIFSIKFYKSGAGFGPEYETVQIEQNIGGKLICESVYNADHHSWNYNIDYKYIDQKGDTLDFKSGIYYGREWDKDEQLKKYKDWLILKTGSWYGSDRLIIKNILSDTTKIFDIDQQSIERNSLWKSKNIHALLNYCCAETFIVNINEDKIGVKYKFRTDKHRTNEYDERNIIYTLDSTTGEIKLPEIK